MWLDHVPWRGCYTRLLLLLLFPLHQRCRPGLDGAVLLPDRRTALHSIQIQHYFTSSFDFVSNSTSELLPTLSSGDAAWEPLFGLGVSLFAVRFQALKRGRGLGASCMLRRII